MVSATTSLRIATSAASCSAKTNQSNFYVQAKYMGTEDVPNRYMYPVNVRKLLWLVLTVEAFS